MKSLHIVSSMVLAAAVVSGVPGLAQGVDSLPAPSGARIGFEGGVTHAVPGGEWETERTLLGPIAAIAFDLSLPILPSSTVRLEAVAGFQERSVERRYRSAEEVVLVTEERMEKIIEDFDNLRSGAFDYYFIAPSLKYYPWRFLYAGAGGEIGILANGWTQFTKTAIQHSVMLPYAGPTVIHFFDGSDPYRKTFPAKDRDDAGLLSVYGILYIGADIPLGEGISIGPRITYGIPFTTTLASPELRPAMIDITLGFRYAP